MHETVTNEGGVELEYVWQQHLALGAPLLGPTARLDMPAATGVTETEAEPFQHGRLAGETPVDQHRLLSAGLGRERPRL
ncbi:MAG: hypothetical protein ACLFVZ_09975 [Actinomycetota bacterium]